MKELTSIQKYIFKKCLQRKPEWKNNSGTLKEIIKMADIQGDGYKRITVIGKGTYLVPIEDILCFGIKGKEVPLKYRRID